jgi:deferrochelatase/peroxidase EfeB
LGTIHFARWVLIPGTNQLMFFSNFGGSWESYLEDFITQAHGGLTGVWSNTEGFPRTKNLFQDGATDGDRFKRWARRRQTPTRFWYSAYPYLTTARIRLNCALRHGLAVAATEDAAADWLSCFGSRPRGPNVLEVNEVQTILFGGLKPLTRSSCLLLKLPPSSEQAKTWLAEIAPDITFGDGSLSDSARLLVFTPTGLRALGCEQDVLAEFPVAFQEGMAAAHRAKLLGDTGDDQPAAWWWGAGDRSVDAALLLYHKTDEALAREVEQRSGRIAALGGSVVWQVALEPIQAGSPTKEPFGFVDGVSQPIVRGTRRWIAEADAIHVVEPGEVLLGYLDNRGFLPNTPRVSPAKDPHFLLPAWRPELAASPLPTFVENSSAHLRDLGRNGTFFVIRQLEQDVQLFNSFLQAAAAKLSGAPGVPAGFDPAQLEQWLGAKMVGRWKDGTSLVRYPHHPGTGWQGERKDVEPDNAFLLGAEDPLAHKCPFGAHIRRSNPRESFTPGSKEQLEITNRHRILRVGRAYKPAPGENPGLLFMCLNADIERQFEFIQQTWAMNRLFHGLDGEVDSILGRGNKGGRITIPTPDGPILVSGIKDFVRVRGGDYFFMPSRSAIKFLIGGAHPAQSQAKSHWQATSV